MSISEGEGRNSIKVFLITLIILFCTVKTNVFANSLYPRMGSGKYIFVWLMFMWRLMNYL